MAVFHRLQFVFIQQGKPFVHPLLGGIGVILNVDIGQDLNAVGAHIVDILKALLQVLLKPKLGRVTVQRHAALRTLFLVAIHLLSLLPFRRT